jgi:hypothetical protein
MPQIKSFLILIFIYFPFLLFSQSSNKELNKTLEKKEIEFKKEFYFNKAHSFFRKKNWDSTLVYPPLY